MSKKPKMKISDYLRLGKISVSARKKTSRNTVFGMTFGLVLLIPMIFFALTFYMDLSGRIDELKLVTISSIPLKNINDPSISTKFKKYSAGGYGEEGVSAFSNYDNVIETEGLDEYILSEYRNLVFMNGSQEEVSFVTYNNLGNEDESYVISKDFIEGQQSNATVGLYKLRIVFPELSTSSMFTTAELLDYKHMTNSSSPFLSYCNDGFTKSTEGFGEIILSETILDLWKIDKENIAGEVISIKYPVFSKGKSFNNRINVDTDYNPNNEYNRVEGAADEYTSYLCYKYKVVGILNDKYYDLPGRELESHIWVTSPSVYFPVGKIDYSSLSYTLTEADEVGVVMTFNHTVEDILEMNIEDKYMFFLHTAAESLNVNYSNDFSASSSFSLPSMVLLLRFENFKALSAALPLLKQTLNNTYMDMSPIEFQGKMSNTAFSQFKIIEQIGSILIIVFSTIGGILLFTNILNLINTVRYSVESRKNYIGVMRAIGARSKVIPGLYMFEMLIIFFRTFIFTAIFASAISLGLKYGLDYAFKSLAEIYTFTINIIYYPIAFFATFLFTAFIGLLFSFLSSRAVAYSPILETLYDSK